MLFDHPMSPIGNPGLAYGEAISYRVTGAARAAPLGAVAVLVRSLTTRSLGVPHTGSMRLLEGKAKNIPAACVSVEDAELLHRLASRGDIPKLHLTLRPQTLPDADSANVIGELRGRELPNEIVLIGAHLDSWDIGQGAQDDGAGVVTVMQALTTLALARFDSASNRARCPVQQRGKRPPRRRAIRQGSQRRAWAARRGVRNGRGLW
ncbi:MAG: M28 family peptidase [Pseudomonadota bacterium]